MLISPVEIVCVSASTLARPSLKAFVELDLFPRAIIVMSARTASSFSILSTRSKLPSARMRFTIAMESVREVGWELNSLFEPLSEVGENRSFAGDALFLLLSIAVVPGHGDLFKEP